jgi:hypothetical protein
MVEFRGFLPRAYRMWTRETFLGIPTSKFEETDVVIYSSGLSDGIVLETDNEYVVEPLFGDDMGKRRSVPKSVFVGLVIPPKGK